MASLLSLVSSVPSTSRQLLQAEQIGNMLEGEWFFSRGVYQHSKNEFVLYTDLSAGPELLRAAPKRSSTSTSGPDDVAESDASRPARSALKRQKVSSWVQAPVLGPGI